MLEPTSYLTLPSGSMKSAMIHADADNYRVYIAWLPPILRLAENGHRESATLACNNYNYVCSLDLGFLGLPCNPMIRQKLLPFPLFYIVTWITEVNFRLPHSSRI